MIKKGHKIEGSKVLVLGITFKENCPDIRNSRVIDVVEELKEFNSQFSTSNSQLVIYDIKSILKDSYGRL